MQRRDQFGLQGCIEVSVFLGDIFGDGFALGRNIRVLLQIRLDLGVKSVLEQVAYEGLVERRADLYLLIISDL